jgi:hypothetical protein
MWSSSAVITRVGEEIAESRAGSSGLCRKTSPAPAIRVNPAMSRAPWAAISGVGGTDRIAAGIAWSWNSAGNSCCGVMFGRSATGAPGTSSPPGAIRTSRSIRSGTVLAISAAIQPPKEAPTRSKRSRPRVSNSET